MEYLSLKEVQSELTKMLAYLTNVLEENGINYFVSSGTCLGVIRHGGFIPWDNDIDLFMFKEDYQKLSDYIYELTGTRSKYYRFPGGSGNEISNVNMAEFVNILNQEQITYFDWNVSAGDASNGYTTQDVLDNVLGGISKYKTSVVLLHDGENKSTTVEALGSLIQSLKSQGAEILPIDENTDVIP